MENIIAEAKSLAENGVKELIVVAQDTTRYGIDIYNEYKLPALLKEICKIDGIEWVRLHYLYPEETDEELLQEYTTHRPKVNDLQARFERLKVMDFVSFAENKTEYAENNLYD